MSNNLNKVNTTLSLSLSVEESLKRFFKDIDEKIKKHDSYKESNGTLDYLLMRRFLETMFNNMREMDYQFVTQDLLDIYHDLQDMSSVYDTYQSQVAFPALAFEKVFLSQQQEYMQLKDVNDKLKKEIDIMSAEERSLRSQIEHKLSVLAQQQRGSQQYELNAKDVRKLKGQYADIVHKIALKKEQMQKNAERLYDFEDLYKPHFKKLFNAESKKYKEALISILNAQAYVFDYTLWEHAKASDVIKEYFKKAQIVGEFSSLTYMKYYLNSLNAEHHSEEQAQMKELYEYLRQQNVVTILVLQAEVEDALQTKALFSTCTLDVHVEIFVDEAKSIKWAKKHKVSLLILDEQLKNLNAKQYIAAYKSRVSEYVQSLVISSHKPEKLGATASIPLKHTKAEFIEVVKDLIGV